MSLEAWLEDIPGPLGIDEIIVGTRLEIGDCVGEGGFGKVHLLVRQATSGVLNEPTNSGSGFVIKLDKGNVDRIFFIAEMYVVRIIAQRIIVNPDIADDGLIALAGNPLIRLEDGTWGIIAPHFSEGDMYQYFQKLIMSREKLTFETAMRIMIDITRAIQILHQNSIVHGNLNVKNVLLRMDADDSLRAAIADFGHGKVLGSEHPDLVRISEDKLDGLKRKEVDQLSFIFGRILAMTEGGEGSGLKADPRIEGLKELIGRMTYITPAQEGMSAQDVWSELEVI